MSLNKILSALVAGILAKLPFSLMVKMADGKMSKEEFAMLKQEVIEIVIFVFNDLAMKQGMVSLTKDLPKASKVDVEL